MKAFSEGLRWKLVLGCLVVVAIEAPEAGAVLAEDLAGPYRAETLDTAGPVQGRRAADPRAEPTSPPSDFAESPLVAERRAEPAVFQDGPFLSR